MESLYYGARPLRRAIQKYIEDPFAEAIMQNRVPSGSDFEIYLEGDVLFYIRRGEAAASAMPL
jgi:ATP-dependent Clp protease ATP-binding subunit ClpA